MTPRRPWLLDGFAGQGGACKGYQEAGFRVLGVDRVDHSGYYPGDDFVQGDFLDFVESYGHMFDAIHTSPPCQPYTRATCGNLAARENYDRLIAVTREACDTVGRPYVIENVEQAASELKSPILLCGRMFGLGADDEDGLPLVLDRHRLFESNTVLSAPEHRPHDDTQVAGVYGGGRRAKRRPGETLAQVAPRDRYAARHIRKGGYVPRSKRVQQQLLGINWMTIRGMQESIPPVYTMHLGLQLMELL